MKVLKIQTISSGSAGNITYVATETTGILVDVGLSLSMTLKLLHQAQIDPTTISGILITHEHSDHIKGVADFALKFDTPIYCHEKATKVIQKYVQLPPHHFHEYHESFNLGDIVVNFFSVPHDSQFCLGYTFTHQDAAVGIATDIGQMTPTILANLAQCQVVVLESNHDVPTLMANPRYPTWLKRRILGNRGHLSNIDCGHAIAQLYQGQVTQVILAHLSEKNNTPTLAYQTVKQYLQSQGINEGSDIYIDVAGQSQIGNCYCLD